VSKICEGVSHVPFCEVGLACMCELFRESVRGMPYHFVSWARVCV